MGRLSLVGLIQEGTWIDTNVIDLNSFIQNALKMSIMRLRSGIMDLNLDKNL